MPYASQTLTTLSESLARSLGDPLFTFWVQDELKRYLRESLRTWGFYASYWRARRQFATITNQQIYDLSSAASLGATPLLVVESNQSALINDIQYALVEPFSDFTSSGYTYTNFPTTGQFSATQINDAVIQACAQFQFDVGMVLSEELPQSIPSAPSYILELDNGVADVRHLQLKFVTPGDPSFNNKRITLRRQDEFDAQYNRLAVGSLVNEGIPYAYSFLLPNTQPSLRLIPPPNISALAEIISIRSDRFPATDWQYATKWLALHFLLSADGQSRDHARADYCRKRYEDALLLSRISPSVLVAYVNNAPVPVIQVSDMDSWEPGWQNVAAGMSRALIAYGWNIFGLHPKPDSTGYAISLEMNIEAPIPEVASLQIANEHVQSVLDYARHLAVFKLGGAEFFATQPLWERFFKAAMEYNSKLAVEARNFNTMKDISSRDKEARYQRRIDTDSSDSITGG